MSKLKNPLFSLSGKGGLGKAVSFVKRGLTNIAEKKPEVPDAKTLAQLSWRHMYQKAVALWHALSVAERQEWESLARPKHMTGFAWFVSQALKPNPGLYLPLQGGTMSGAIEMDGQHIHGLPEPIHLQDPLRRQDYVDYIQPWLHYQGCSVWRTAHQSIPTATYTFLIFNSTIFDTDDMHSTVVDPERITIKTTGHYLITFHGHFDTNAVGYRRVYIRQNGFLKIQDRKSADLSQRTTFSLSTILSLIAGQYLRVEVYQNSGAPLNFVRASNYSPIFSAQRIG